MQVVIEIPDGTNDELRLVASRFNLNSQRTTFGNVTTLVITKEDNELGRANQLQPGSADLPESVEEALARSLETLRLT